MTRLLLCRHGETDHNRERIMQGQTDVELNARGERQAERLAAHLADEDVDAVYASDLSRAHRTAELVAERHGLTVEELPELRERSYGEFEGKHLDERDRRVQEQDVSLDDWKPPAGEDFDDVVDRAFPVIESIRDAHPDGTVVVVAHGWVNRALLLAALDGTAGEGQRIKQDNTAVNELRYHDWRGWRIHAVNDTSHLD